MTARCVAAWLLAFAALFADVPEGGARVALVAAPFVALAGLPSASGGRRSALDALLPLCFVAPLAVLAARDDLGAGAAPIQVGGRVGVLALLVLGLAYAALRGRGSRLHAIAWFLVVPGIPLCALGLGVGGVSRAGWEFLSERTPLDFALRPAFLAQPLTAGVAAAALGGVALVVLAAEASARTIERRERGPAG